MYRKYIADLEKWVKSERRKPLMIWGARQVGKTYLIRDLFASKYFKDKYIYVDCKTNNEFVDYAFNHTNPKDIINFLSLKNDMIINKDTLLIFDEAQECLPIVTLMKYFCDEFREIPIIVTGSMVRIKIVRENSKRGQNNITNKFLFPIGKINQLTIYPLNFEEYLINRNKVLYDAILNDYSNHKKSSDLTHNEALKIFYEFLLVGGMPEACDVFLETKNYQESRNTLKELYDNYLSDMSLYQASDESIIRARKVFQNIFNELNKESKNFKSSLIEKNTRSRDYENPIDWLELAYIVNKSHLVKETVTIPLIDSNESLFRLYLSDTGLFSLQSNIDPTTFINKNTTNTLSGIFFENYVANELINQGYKLFYWNGKNNSEFEFVIEYDSYIIPIDVKKSRGSLNSLEKFKNHNKLFLAIKISSNNLGYNKESKILTIPFYLVPFILKDLKNNTFNNLINNLESYY